MAHGVQNPNAPVLLHAKMIKPAEHVRMMLYNVMAPVFRHVVPANGARVFPVPFPTMARQNAAKAFVVSIVMMDTSQAAIRV